MYQIAKAGNLKKTKTQKSITESQKLNTNRFIGKNDLSTIECLFPSLAFFISFLNTYIGGRFNIIKREPLKLISCSILKYRQKSDFMVLII